MGKVGYVSVICCGGVGCVGGGVGWLLDLTDAIFFYKVSFFFLFFVYISIL